MKLGQINRDREKKEEKGKGKFCDRKKDGN